jgi:hypothetical protein
MKNRKSAIVHRQSPELLFEMLARLTNAPTAQRRLVLRCEQELHGVLEPYGAAGTVALGLLFAELLDVHGTAFPIDPAHPTPMSRASHASAPVSGVTP